MNSTSSRWPDDNKSPDDNGSTVQFSTTVQFQTVLLNNKMHLPHSGEIRRLSAAAANPTYCAAENVLDITVKITHSQIKPPNFLMTSLIYNLLYLVLWVCSQAFWQFRLVMKESWKWVSQPGGETYISLKL